MGVGKTGHPYKWTARKFLQENTGSNFLDISLSNIFLDMSPRKANKRKNKGGVLHHEKGVNSLKRLNNSQCICT